MSRNSAQTPARARFAQLLTKYLLEGRRPQKISGDPWTFSAFSSKLSVSSNSVSNWSKGKSLPSEIDPILETLFGNNIIYASEKDELRAAYQKAYIEHRSNVLSQAPYAPGPTWSIDRNSQFSINSGALDYNYETPPISRSMQGEVALISLELASCASRLSNSRIWGGLPKAASEFGNLLTSTDSNIESSLVKCYTLMLKLARYLETDVRVQLDPNQLEGPLDSDIHGLLNDLVRLAAPWIRGYPIIAKWDDEAGKALIRPELFQPAKEFTRIARNNSAISEKDANAIEEISSLADADYFQGKKAHEIAINSAQNLMLVGVKTVANSLKNDPFTDTEDRPLIVQRSLATLSAAEKQVNAISNALSSDVKGAITELIEQISKRENAQGLEDLKSDKSRNIIEDLKKQNEKLKNSAIMRDTFIHHMSYELRSPLTNITGFAQLLGDETVGSLNERQREYSEHIMRSSTALLVIINDILDLASIDASALELRREVVDVRMIIDSAFRGVEDRLAESNIGFDLDVPKDIGNVFADAKRLRQVLFNLLSNAIGFSAPGQTVRIEARRNSSELIINVIDQGRGISPDIIDHVFDRFESNTLGSRHRGVGLGLSISRAFVELHGGEISIVSTPGKGTRVTCKIPI